jgi:hypothetical protein
MRLSHRINVLPISTFSDALFGLIASAAAPLSDFRYLKNLIDHFEITNTQPTVMVGLKEV